MTKKLQQQQYQCFDVSSEDESCFGDPHAGMFMGETRQAGEASLLPLVLSLLAVMIVALILIFRTSLTAGSAAGALLVVMGIGYRLLRSAAESKS